MDRELKRLIALGVAAALLAALLVALIVKPAEDTADPTVFRSGEPTDVVNIVIDNGHGRFTVSASEGGYLIQDFDGAIVDMDAFIGLMTWCGELSAADKVSRPDEDMSLYGLDKPVATAVIEYSDGEEITVKLGTMEQVSGRRYATVSKSSGVFLFDGEGAGWLLGAAQDYIDHLVTEELNVSSPLSAVLNATFTGGGLEYPVSVVYASGSEEMRLQSLSFGAVTHIVLGKSAHELDQTYGVEILGSLLGIRADDIVAYGLTEERIAELGFDKPYMEVAFDVKNGADAEQESIRLSLLNAPDGGYYITRWDNGVVYHTGELAFIDVDYDRLMMRWFLTPMLMDIEGVTVSGGGKTYEFALGGESNSDRTVALNGAQFDIARFRTFYSLLVSASADSAPLGDAPDVSGEPLLTVTFNYIDADKSPDVMRFFTSDAARRCLVEVNGVVEFDMQSAYCDCVLEALGVIDTDQEIQTVW